MPLSYYLYSARAEPLKRSHNGIGALSHWFSITIDLLPNDLLTYLPLVRYPEWNEVLISYLPIIK